MTEPQLRSEEEIRADLALAAPPEPPGSRCPGAHPVTSAADVNQKRLLALLSWPGRQRDGPGDEAVSEDRKRIEAAARALRPGLPPVFYMGGRLFRHAREIVRAIDSYDVASSGLSVSGTQTESEQQ